MSALPTGDDRPCRSCSSHLPPPATAEPLGVVWRCQRCRERIGVLHGRLVVVRIHGHEVTAWLPVQRRCGTCGAVNVKQAEE